VVPVSIDFPVAQAVQTARAEAAQVLQSEAAVQAVHTKGAAAAVAKPSAHTARHSFVAST